MPTSLIRKYNVPGPRYTSYPTVPFWKEEVQFDEWKKRVKHTFDITNTSKGISIYVHLPYCESLCTYCGCTTRITINHAVEKPYIETVLREWQLYLAMFQDVPEIAEIHLGGGTPTFFSPESLTQLIEGIKQTAVLRKDAELGFEGHPNNTTSRHLQVLYDLGFRRVSFGIQDFDPKVQKIINRIQTFDQVKKVTDLSRAIGYESVNFDLIYGLPLQTQDSIIDTFEKVKTLRPDRIAFYSYAHVPWVKPGQRMFTEDDLPGNETKRSLYELGKKLLTEIGYKEIGMDHFSLPEDGLYQSSLNGKMHRNFMGYTTSHSMLSVGLGVSAIGDAWNAYGQNLKKVEEYKRAVDKGQFPIFKTHTLTFEEAYVRSHITNLMCKFETSWEENEALAHIMQSGVDRLQTMIDDELVVSVPGKLMVTAKGRPFVRNICMAIDIHLWEEKDQVQKFSLTI